jgi:hypothetical protein
VAYVDNDNVASGDYSSVLAGQFNDTNEQTNAHLLGSYLTADEPNTTYVEGLKLRGPLTEGFVEHASSGASPVITLDDGGVQAYALTDDCIFTMPAPIAGRSFTVILTQLGAYTAVFADAWWPAGIAPEVTPEVGAIDIFRFVSDGTNWFGTAAQDFLPDIASSSSAPL